MIDAAFTDLVPQVGVKAACALLGVSRATHYRRLAPPPVRVHAAPRAAPPNALSEVERARVLALLRAPQNCDLAVAQVWARELDEGRYHASISTMYRILRAEGEVRERRSQATHPAKVKPELLASAPNMVWSWDIERHEALLNRAVVKGHRLRAVAAGRVKLRAA